MNTSEVNPELLCPILEEVAKQYEKGSPQDKAIEIAAFALHFIFIENKLSDFSNFVDSAEQGLTDSQKENLQSMGLELHD